MTLQLHRPDGRGGLVGSPPPTGRKGKPDDWRRTLRSPRWRVAPLSNSEMNPTSSVVAIAFWAALAVLTFALLVVGYGSHFWH